MRAPFKVGFSRDPATLRRHLVSNASSFEDFATKPGGWFGPFVEDGEWR